VQAASTPETKALVLLFDTNVQVGAMLYLGFVMNDVQVDAMPYLGFVMNNVACEPAASLLFSTALTPRSIIHAAYCGLWLTSEPPPDPDGNS
jgi:hypothetical protein